jgi:PAS domain S-box-containing protein
MQPGAGAGAAHGISADEILDAIGHAVIVTDTEGRVMLWNAAARELYGWSSEEAVGRPISDLTVPAIAQDLAKTIMAALVSGKAWSGSFPVRRKDGTTFPALVTDTGVYRDGELVGIVGVSTNLGRAMQPMLERSTDAALVLRPDAVITYASPAVAELFGWTEPVVGTSVVPLLHPDERPALATFLEQVVTRPGTHPPLELRLLSETGWVWTEAAVTNLLDDPEVRGIVCNLRRSVRRDALEAAAEQVEQLTTALHSRVMIEQAKGYLAARHDLGTEEAFERLRRYARSHHLGLHEAARQVVAGELDPI